MSIFPEVHKKSAQKKGGSSLFKQLQLEKNAYPEFPESKIKIAHAKLLKNKKIFCAAQHTVMPEEFPTCTSFSWKITSKSVENQLVLK